MCSYLWLSGNARETVSAKTALDFFENLVYKVFSTPVPIELFLLICFGIDWVVSEKSIFFDFSSILNFVLGAFRKPYLEGVWLKRVKKKEFKGRGNRKETSQALPGPLTRY